MMHSLKLIVLAGAATLAASATAATFTQRDTNSAIDVSGGFGAATTTYTNVVTLPAGGSDQTNSLTLKTGWKNLTFSTTGTVGSTYTVPAAGSATVTGTVTNGGSGGTFHFNYVTANGPDFNTSFTTLETVGGRHALEFNGGGTNFVDTGGTFNSTVTITGDWSKAGTGNGDHTLNGLNSAFTVTNNFTFAGGLTTFAVTTNNFQGGSPSIDFTLFGAVPEPAMWSLLIAGFGLTGIAVRRRQTAIHLM